MTRPSRLPADSSRSAAYPLFAVDAAGDRGLVLHFTADDYRRASFLDERALQHREVGGWWLGREELAAAWPVSARPRIQWLFHIGHCGSTLCSRLLDLVPGTLGIREPMPLLGLAQDAPGGDPGAWRPLVLQALGRGFEDTVATVVKPTSLVTSMANVLLDASEGNACLLWVDLQTWLTTMLRDPGLVTGALSTPAWRADGVGGAPPAGEAEALARLWLADQLRWCRLRADAAVAPRLLDLEFGRVLEAPADTIAGLASHFGLAAPDDLAARIDASGWLSRYAKDARQPFDATTRARELHAAGERHADAIATGVAWAVAALASAPEADRAHLLPRLRPGRQARKVVIA